jgi:predicted RNase H-like nuclease (RuvC/YqgF family)
MKLQLFDAQNRERHQFDQIDAQQQTVTMLRSQLDQMQQAQLASNQIKDKEMYQLKANTLNLENFLFNLVKQLERDQPQPVTRNENLHIIEAQLTKILKSLESAYHQIRNDRSTVQFLVRNFELMRQDMDNGYLCLTETRTKLSASKSVIIDLQKQNDELKSLDVDTKRKAETLEYENSHLQKSLKQKMLDQATAEQQVTQLESSCDTLRRERDLKQREVSRLSKQLRTLTQAKEVNTWKHGTYFSQIIL